MPNIVQGDSFKGTTTDLINENYDYDYHDGLDLKPGDELHDRLISLHRSRNTDPMDFQHDRISLMHHTVHDS